MAHAEWDPFGVHNDVSTFCFAIVQVEPFETKWRFYSPRLRLRLTSKHLTDKLQHILNYMSEIPDANSNLNSVQLLSTWRNERIMSFFFFGGFIEDWEDTL